jgi:succinyl-diaminopimelate desuccinylase
LITGDEEGVAINGTRKVLGWLKERGETIDACVVGEPTSATQLGDMIKIGRRGSMTGRITVEGVQGHVAYPHLADNAAHRLVALLAGLIAQPLDDGTEHFQKSGLQVTTIDIGNPTTNVIPGVAKATFNIRFNDVWTSAKLKAWVKDTLDRVDPKYKLVWEVSGESFLVPPGKVSDCLSGAIGEITGLTPELSTTGGTSDARFIQAYCPVAEFGLVGQTMHKVDERVELSDIARLVAIYGGFLDRFFGNA